jgi:hypothetical protein
MSNNRKLLLFVFSLLAEDDFVSESLGDLNVSERDITIEALMASGSQNLFLKVIRKIHFNENKVER